MGGLPDATGEIEIVGEDRRLSNGAIATGQRWPQRATILSPARVVHERSSRLALRNGQ
jgi:hypothetical protein